MAVTLTQRRERSTSKLNKNQDIEGNRWSITFLGLVIVEICYNSERLIVDTVKIRTVTNKRFVLNEMTPILFEQCVQVGNG